MNTRQIKAISALQHAINRCQSAGLSMAGVDDNLVVFETTVFAAVSHGKGPAEVINEMEYHCMDGPFIDCGAT